MHSRREILTGAMALAAGSASAQTREERARSVTILHTNDFHGRHAAFDVAPGDGTAQTGDPGRDLVQFDRAGRIGGFPVLATALAAGRYVHLSLQIPSARTGSPRTSDQRDLPDARALWLSACSCAASS